MPIVNRREKKIGEIARLLLTGLAAGISSGIFGIGGGIILIPLLIYF